jgi:hypothetical protein
LAAMIVPIAPPGAFGEGAWGVLPMKTTVA